MRERVTCSLRASGALVALALLAFVGTDDFVDGSDPLEITVTFTRIANANTSIPGENFVFTGHAGAFDPGPSISFDRIGFAGLGPDGFRGVFLHVNGGLHAIATTGMTVPGFKDLTFETDFSHVSVHRANAVFAGGYGESPPSPFDHQDTVLLRYNRAIGLETIAGPNTPIPGGVGNFHGFYAPSVHGNDVAFLGFGPDDQIGIYLYNISSGVFRVVADADTSLSGLFSSGPRSCPSVSNGRVAFCAGDSDGNVGIYVWDDDEFEVLASTSAPIPGGDGNFTLFGVCEGFDGSTVALIGFGADGQAGIYGYRDGVLKVVADTNTPLPGGKGDFIGFSRFNSAPVSHGRIVFHGAGEDEQGGLYAGTPVGDGTWDLFDVIQNGDELDGQQLTVNNPTEEPWWEVVPPLSIARDCVDSTKVAFLVGFPDGTSGIYVATMTWMVE